MKQILPGVSSVAAKVLACEIKCGQRLRLEFINIWMANLLPRFFKELGRRGESQKSVSSGIKELLMSKGGSGPMMV